MVAIGSLSYFVALLMLLQMSAVAPAMTAAFIAGTGWVTCLTTLSVAMQLRSPEAILGRCLSIYSAVTFGGMALGAWIWGAIADGWGLAMALLVAAGWIAFTALTMPLVAAMPKPHEGRIPLS
jgi:predicted MFS family arabinose efflux permease